MAPAAPPAPRSARRRLWSTWLWLLAALLGAGMLWSMARIVHDGRMVRDTMGRLAADKAHEIGVFGAQRVDAMTARLFAGLDGQPFDSARQIVARRIVHLSSCNCGNVVGEAVVSPEQGARDQPALSADPDQTRLQSPSGVVVLVPTAALARFAFGHFPMGARSPERSTPIMIRRVHDHGPGGLEPHIQRIVEMDSMSIAVSVAGKPVFGRMADRRFTGTVRAAAPLQAFEVATAISPWQTTAAAFLPVAHDRLWMNAIFIAATVIVVAFAIGSQRRELQLARARSEFIAGVSHDLRMPLAQILLASETLQLQRERTETDRLSLLNSIVREGRRLATLVDNVLLFSRNGDVGPRPVLKPIVLHDLFEQVADAVTLAVADAGQALDARGNGLTVLGDAALLRQALVNLIDNAMKYGPRGQRITLQGAETGNRVAISVSDQGPGIPSSDRHRIFEPYERLSRDRDSERTGSGIGLAVVKQVVEACGGTVRVEDGSPGARFVIELPRA